MFPSNVCPAPDNLPRRRILCWKCHQLYPMPHGPLQRRRRPGCVSSVCGGINMWCAGHGDTGCLFHRAVLADCSIGVCLMGRILVCSLYCTLPNSMHMFVVVVFSFVPRALPDLHALLQLRRLFLALTDRTPPQVCYHTEFSKPHDLFVVVYCN